MPRVSKHVRESKKVTGKHSFSKQPCKPCVNHGLSHFYVTTAAAPRTMPVYYVKLRPAKNAVRCIQIKTSRMKGKQVKNQLVCNILSCTHRNAMHMMIVNSSHPISSSKTSIWHSGTHGASDWDYQQSGNLTTLCCHDITGPTKSITILSN